jgi:phosphoadenosine phosphosulfate reductase
MYAGLQPGMNGGSFVTSLALNNDLNRDDRESQTAAELLAYALEQHGSRIAIASSFGPEDVVLIDVAAKTGLPFRVFTLDTDFLFPETYALIDSIEARYGISIERCRAPLTPAEQAAAHGDALWSRDPDRCCAIRKVAPLQAKLATLAAWVTGIRRDQAPSRANARKHEWDEKFELWKFNPLADWRIEEVWDVIRANDLPYNPLHDRNYPSIGCTYCTRPVNPGEDPRAGRWSGFAKTECGLHKA